MFDLILAPVALRHWDPRGQCWEVEAGPLEVRVARSAGDPGQVVALDVVGPPG